MDPLTLGSTSARFLGSFNRIDAALGRLVLPDKPQGFTDRLRIAASRSEIVAEHAEDLRLLARLRNAIAHESRDSQPIAEPHPGTVDVAIRLAELLEHPPGLVEVLNQEKVVSCFDSEPIGPVIDRMHREDFSQVPVLSWKQPVRLMTAETILHWVAANPSNVDPTKRVSDVMKYSDGCDAAAFLSAASTVGDALRVFRTADVEGRRFWAIIVTPTGSDMEEPIAIATSADVVQLHRAVSL